MLHQSMCLFLCKCYAVLMGFTGGTCGKESACQCRGHKSHGFDPWVGRSPGGGHGNPLLCCCLEKHRDRVAWQVTVHRVAKSWTWLKQFSTHTHAVLTTVLCNIVWNRCDASSFDRSWNCFCYSGAFVVEHIFRVLLISLWKILSECWERLPWICRSLWVVWLFYQ